nr:BTB/POZ and MATH domain-containing protein 3-like [Aegilops tauschii subsp. strangulata]
MAAVLSAVRAAGRQQLSASIVAARQVSASHVLRIDGYSRISKILAIGQATRSGTFSVGGHDWHILHYPNGCFEQHKASLSFLEHASHAKTGDTTAKVELSILDHASKPSHTQTKADYRFSNATSLNWGWRDFIKHEDLDAEKHLKDDCLTILCDVTVTGLRTEDHVEAAAPEPTVVEPPFGMRGLFFF